MKRLFLFIASLCIAVLSYAETYSIDELIGDEYNGIVTIRNVKSAYASQVLTPRTDGQLEMSKKGDLTEKANWDQVWLLERTNSTRPYTYTLRNLLSGEYLGSGPAMGAAVGYYFQSSTIQLVRSIYPRIAIFQE